MVSLIFGLIALVCDLLAWIPPLAALFGQTNLGYLSIVGFILAIVAVATGGKILKSDKSDKAARAGKAIGTVCIVLAVIGIVFWILIAVGVLALLAF